MRAIALSALTIAPFAVPPSAEAVMSPDRSATLTAASPSFSWEGAQATGYHVYWTAPLAFDPHDCNKDPATYCDVTLVHLDAAPESTATLTVTLSDFSSPAADFDVYIYTADKDGTPREAAPQEGCCQPAGTDEVVSLPNAAPGYYLVHVPYWLVADASFKGRIDGADIVAPPAPPPAPAQQQQPATSGSALPLRTPARATIRGRRIDLTVTADQEIASLRAQLKRGNTTYATARAARVQGRGRLTLRAKRKLRPGRYHLAVSGLVAGSRRSVGKPLRLSAARTR